MHLQDLLLLAWFAVSLLGRLQQGLDYLRQFDMEADMKHLGPFLKCGVLNEFLVSMVTDL